MAEEREFLAPFLEPAAAGGVLVVGQIKAALDKRLGREVALASAYNLLHRHNWRKLTPIRVLAFIGFHMLFSVGSLLADQVRFMLGHYDGEQYGVSMVWPFWLTITVTVSALLVLLAYMLRFAWMRIRPPR